MLKIALDAGHDLNTAGKRIPKTLDPKQTREWTLNDRVARYIAEAAALYADVQILRVDDVTGKTDVSLAKRCKKANDWGADLYISNHHNAGISLGKGGGMVAYCYKEGTEAAKYRDAIYEACIAAGGLRGNRSDPTPEKGFYVLKHTNMPAVLMEYGFMDSTADAPVILTEDYAKRMGYAVMEAIAKKHDLKKRTQTNSKEECSVEVKILRKGDKGDQVKAMQLLLIGYGFDCGASGGDGILGAATDKALRAFQKAKGLTVDGICGPKTWGALLGVCA